MIKNFSVLIAENTTRVAIFVIAMFLSLSLTAQMNWNYVSPQPGSKQINPENNIAFRNGEPLDLNSINSEFILVNGSKSGMIKGELKLSVDSRTLIFNPLKPFEYGETVSVELQSGLKTKNGFNLSGESFRFVVKKDDTKVIYGKFDQPEEVLLNESLTHNNQKENKEPLYSSDQLLSYGAAAIPDNFPIPEIMAFDNPSPQLAFYATEPQADRYGTYAVIVDNYGTPVFYREWPGKTVNFHVVPNKQLVHKNVDPNHPTPNSYVVMDDMYNFIDTLRMGNGYSTNTHDMVMLENGNHYMMEYDNQLVGMDTVVTGGDPNATVRGFVLQELDSEHNVLFQWRSWDHFEITDGNHIDYTASTIDYVHVNAIDITDDGNILICCRHFDEITKIDRNTGEIIWRFGPKSQNNMFAFTNDTMGFSYPHDSRQTENGNITLYDNGNFHDPQFSRGMEYEIDEQNLTATLVWDYVHDPVFYCRNKGGTMRLPNDNTIIGWGNSWPIISTEATYDGTVAWELSIDSSLSYRVMKFDWETSYFETNFDTINYGYWDDYIAWPIIFSVTNNADHDIEITSASNHLDAFYLGTPLPLNIGAGESKNMTVFFFPGGMGSQNFEDVLTLNYDSFYADTLHQRIARQIILRGTTIPPSSIEQNFTESLNVNPNPTNGQLNIISDDNLIREIRIFDVSGKLIFTENVGLKKQCELDLSAYKNGLYLFQVFMNDHTEPVLVKVIKN